MAYTKPTIVWESIGDIFCGTFVEAPGITFFLITKGKEGYRVSGPFVPASAENDPPFEEPEQAMAKARDYMTASLLVFLERSRQIVKEGHTPARDERHRKNELLLAAESYVSVITSPDDEPLRGGKPRPHFDWPWPAKQWKPSDEPIRNLVKAAALIHAQIDLLLAQEPKPGSK